MSAVMHHTDMNQRTVPASKAPPVPTRAPSSVFGLASTLGVEATAPAQAQGEAAPGPVTPTTKAPRQTRAEPSRGERTIALLRQRGPMTAAAVGASLGIDNDRASILLCSLKHRGVGVMGKDGRRMLYGLAATVSPPPAGGTDTTEGAAAVPSTPAVAGFKRWLDKNGDASAEGRPVPHKRAKPAAAGVAPASTIPPSAPPSTAHPAPALEPEAPEEPDLICGLFNNGELAIEVGPERLRLTKTQTRKLVTYLDMVSTAALDGGQR